MREKRRQNISLFPPSCVLVCVLWKDKFWQVLLGLEWIFVVIYPTWKKKKDIFFNNLFLKIFFKLQSFSSLLVLTFQSKTKKHIFICFYKLKKIRERVQIVIFYYNHGDCIEYYFKYKDWSVNIITSNSKE